MRALTLICLYILSLAILSGCSPVEQTSSEQTSSEQTSAEQTSAEQTSNQAQRELPALKRGSIDSSSSTSPSERSASLQDQRSSALRVLSLAPSHTEWVYALGAEGQLVGRTSSCDVPPQARHLPSVGALFPPDLELIVAQRPTDVLMISGHDPLKAQLRRLGLRVHTLQPQTFDELMELPITLGALLGAQERAKAWVIDAQKKRPHIDPNTRPSVFIEVWHSPLSTAGAESFMGALVEAAGGRVVIQEMGSWPQVSMEELIELDPEVILISTESLFRMLVGPKEDRPRVWRSLSAVRSGRVYWLEGRLVRPGPRVIDDLIWLASKLGHRRMSGRQGLSPTP